MEKKKVVAEPAPVSEEAALSILQQIIAKNKKALLALSKY